MLRCAIWYYLYKLKNVKNIHGGMNYTNGTNGINCTNGTKSRKTSQIAETEITYESHGYVTEKFRVIFIRIRTRYLARRF